MLGWYPDEIIVYLFRTMVRLIAEHDSETWPVAEAKVETSSSPESFYPIAEAIYSYTAEGKSYSGTAKRAFWLSSSAKRYADRFASTSRLAVRYDAKEPAESVLRELDQST
jgi:hypothetical protein